MTVVPIDGTGVLVEEPDWQSLFSDVLEIAAASEYWRVVTTELKDRGLLAPANGHALQRLVCAYIGFDRANREVAESGAVIKPSGRNSKAITRLNPYFVAMRELASDAATLEAELGIAPRRRTGAAKAERKVRAPRAADQFIRRATN